MKKWLSLVLMLLFLLPVSVRADQLYEGEEGYYTVHDGQGQVLFRTAGRVYEGDEYIASDNRRYRVTQVDERAKRAAAQFVEDVVLPEIDFPAAQTDWVPKVALYCTHTDESYIQGDGSESIAEGGGILDIASLLAQSLKKEGCEAVLDETNHVPHDAGAYRRSRQTAMALMREQWPTLLLDIHRDAVPEDEYLEKVDGNDISAVRIVIGRGNANYPVNEELAQTVKAIADARYPGLIKDIYLGKGDYNQDLMPRALLLEFGSHETDKTMAEKSTQYLSEVISVALGVQNPGEETPQQQPGQEQPARSAEPEESPRAAVPPDESGHSTPTGGVSGRGMGKSVGILALILAAAGGIALFFAAGGKRGEAASHWVREMTGLGSRPDPDRDEHR